MDAQTNEVAAKEEMCHAALELAQYASYAEIIGAIGHNREPIRKWCDEVFRLSHILREIRYAREEAKSEHEALEAQSTGRF